MNRLTIKDKECVGGYTSDGVYDISWQANAFEKLGKLEDIEEIIEKIYKQPIYVNCDLDIFEFDYTNANILYNFKNNTIEIYEIIVPYVRNFLGEYKVEDYCKTWAFTKEELEK